MTDQPLPQSLADEMHELVTASLRRDISVERRARLDELVCLDIEACDLYLNLVFESSALIAWGKSSGAENELSPMPALVGNTRYGTWGFFSSDWPVAYLVATVIFGIGLLIGSHVYVSQPVQVARQSVPLPSPLFSLPSTVGRITGMVDCQWKNDECRMMNDELSARNNGIHLSSFIPHPSTPVSLGDTFALATGLMELTYDTGAKVILQGPVTYEVESKDGGFLSLGKLTARVTKNDKLQVKNNDIHHSSFINHHLFSVRTPTATVTDLGTEFGVEVKEAGTTEAHVLHGRIEVQRRDAGGHVLETIRLAENQAVRVEDVFLPISRMRASSERFVRSIPRDRRLDVLAWYKFDDIIDGMVLRTPDSSGHGRSATLQEMARDNLVPGKAGKALAFNVAKGAVNQRVTLPWTPAFDFVGQSFAVALWINRQAAGVEEDETILHKEAGSGSDAGGYSIMRQRKSGRLVFRARNSAGQATCIATTTLGDDAPLGVWVHFAVVGVYDPGSNSYRVTLYRNGVHAGGQDNVAMAAPRLPLSIGGLENGWAFRGWLDDLQIYSRALNETEIRAVVAHPGAIPPAEPPNQLEGGQAMNGP